VLVRGFQTLLQMPLAYQNMECDFSVKSSVVPSVNIRSVTYQRQYGKPSANRLGIYVTDPSWLST
jgi:hypothetical protein